MWLRSLINFGEATDTVIGINLLYIPGGKRFSYCILKKRKDVVHCLACVSNINSVDELLASLKHLLQKGVRVHVNISGKQILDKVVLPGGDASDVGKLLPGIKKEEFVTQRYQSSREVVFSFFRKQEFLEEMKGLSGHIHSISLSVFVIEAIIPVLTRHSVSINGYRLNLTDQEVSILSTEENPDHAEVFNIAGTDVPENCLLAFAGGFQFFVPVKKISASGVPETLQRLSLEYAEKKEVYQVAKIVLLVVLLIMILNAFMFFWLSQRITDTEARLSFYKTRSRKNEDDQLKSKILNLTYSDIGWSLNRLPLYYADQLASTVPTEIQLSKLEIGTLNESTFRKDKKYQFDSRQVRVQGLSPDPAVLNKWILSLQKKTWIAHIERQRYQQDARQKKGIFEFIIVARNEY